MSRNWLVQVPESPADDAVWTWIDASDAAAQPVTGDLAALAEAVLAPVAGRRQPVIALLPATAMLVAPVSVPVRQQRQLQQALPFLLEENLASEIERFHVVAGARIDSATLQAVAVEHDVMRRALATLQSVGIDPDIVGGLGLHLPVPDAGSTVLLDGADSLLVTAAGTVLPFDEADAAGVVAALPAGARTAVQVLRGTRGRDLAVSSLESALADAGEGVAITVSADVRDRLAWCAQALRDSTKSLPANLRQGAWQRAGGSSFSPGFAWQPLAWLAASWAVLALGYQVALGITQGREADAVREAQVALYRQVFPGKGDVPQPRRQMEGQLRTSTGGTSFSSLVARTAETMIRLDNGAGRFTPRNLAWDSTRGELRIDIVARSLEDLEQLRLALQEQGLAVDIGAGVSQDGGYKARMNVGEGA